MVIADKFVQTIIEWLRRHVWPELEKQFKELIAAAIVALAELVRKAVAKYAERQAARTQAVKEEAQQKYEDAVRAEALAPTDEEARIHRAVANAWKSMAEQFMVEQERQRQEIKTLRDELERACGVVQSDASASVAKLAPASFVDAEKVKKLGEPPDLTIDIQSFSDSQSK